MARLQDYGAALRFPKDNPADYKGIMEFRRLTVAPPEIEVGNVFDFLNRYLSKSLEDAEGQPLVEAPGTGGSNGELVASRRTHTNSYPNVTLYLPQAITLNDGVIYDNTVQLGVAGAAAENAINNGESIGSAINTAVATGLSTFTDLFMNNATPDMARLAVTRAATNPGVPGLVGDVIGSTLRTTINPNRRVLFRAVTPREFTFQFKLIASSPEEAMEIDRIINFFRTELYPEGIGEELSIGYKYPNMFDIRMLYAGTKVGYAFLPCYLSSMQVVINPTAMSFHTDGKPSEVDVSLNFLEERALVKQDIEKGY